MTVLSDEVRALLDQPCFGTFATIEPDGRPHQAVVWFERDGDDVLVSTLCGRRKERNLRRDPRAGLAVIDPENPYSFVEIRGTVSLIDDGADDLIDRLSQRYRGYSPYGDDGDEDVRVTLQLRPDRVRSRFL